MASVEKSPMEVEIQGDPRVPDRQEVTLSLENVCLIMPVRSPPVCLEIISSIGSPENITHFTEIPRIH